MKIRIFPHQIRRITSGRYADLYRRFLGLDIESRNVTPIDRGVYYVDAKDPIGRSLIAGNTPAKCVYRTGEIFCLYDERIPLTEARLVHEFIHRIARRQVFFLWTSGLDTSRKYTLLNEALTEYFTNCVLGRRYVTAADERNLYRPFLPMLSAVEKHAGRKAMAQAYLNGNLRFFRRYKRELSTLL